MNYRRSLKLFLMIAAIFLSACNLFSQLAPTLPPVPTLPAITLDPEMLDDQIVLPTLPELELPTTDAGDINETLVGGLIDELGEAVEAETKGAATEAAVQALADSKGAAIDQITVESVESQTWPDTCFDVPRTDTACQSFAVPGFQIFLLLKGNRYEVRTNLDGSELVLVP